jgi:hypothetical protein
MGCGGSVPVHPAPAAEPRRLPDEDADAQARIASLEEQLAQALAEVGGLRAQLQLEGAGSAQRPGVRDAGGAETATARGGESIQTPGGAKVEAAVSTAPSSEREDGSAKDAAPQTPPPHPAIATAAQTQHVPTPGAPLPPIPASPSVPTLQVQEFASGLQEGLQQALVLGLVKGLGLDNADDPRNIADLLLELKDSGKGLLQEHCVPLMVQCVADGVAALREAREDSVAAANSRYADDPEAYVATLGTISEFEMGLDRYNGRPDGDNVELQMQIEFADDTSFKTSNYGGVETTLRYAKRNPEAPNKEL